MLTAVSDASIRWERQAEMLFAGHDLRNGPTRVYEPDEWKNTCLQRSTCRRQQLRVFQDDLRFLLRWWSYCKTVEKHHAQMHTMHKSFKERRSWKAGKKPSIEAKYWHAPSVLGGTVQRMGPDGPRNFAHGL